MSKPGRAGKTTIRTLNRAGGMSRVARVAAHTATAVLFLTGAASAHEGHGVPGTGDSVLHYLLDPAHGVPVAVALVLVGLAARRLLRATASGRSRRLP